MKKYGTVALTVLFCTSGIEANAQPTDGSWLGDDRGPYPTGTLRDMWIDEDREELLTQDPDDRRRVVVQVWYPAAMPENPQYASYAIDVQSYNPPVQQWVSLIADRSTNSLLDAPLAESPETFPVLIYNNGSGGPVFSGTSQTEFLASHGYVVISVAHSDDSGMAAFPDGTAFSPDNFKPAPSREATAAWSPLELYEFQKGYFADLLAWHVKDLSFAIDKLEELNASIDSPLYDRLDLERLGAFGWSRGGATALQVTVDDPRVDAAVNFDGTIFGQSVQTEGTTKPILLLEGYPDVGPSFGGEMDAAGEEITAALETEKWRMLSRSTNDWYRARLLGARHTTFSDRPHAIPPEPMEGWSIDYKLAHEIINAVTLEFFDRYLRDSSRSPILNGETSYPELRIARKISNSED